VDALTLLGLWCTTLSIAFVWPQVARVYRQHTVEGIAPMATLHVATASALWFLYGLSLGDLAIIVANAAVVVAQALIGVQQVRAGVLTRRAAGLTALAVIGLGLLALAVSPALVGWAAILAGATSVLPQTFHVLRAEALHGVSIATYLLLSVTAASWALYGFATGEPLVIVTNLVVLPCALLVTGRTWVAQRRAEPPMVGAVATAEVSP
jgi:uncharacterized protein with PQ loop repeat